jgi:hypothetical protein
MTDTTADEAWEQEGRINIDMEPDELLGVLLNTDLRDTADEDVRRVTALLVREPPSRHLAHQAVHTRSVAQVALGVPENQTRTGSAASVPR